MRMPPWDDRLRGKIPHDSTVCGAPEGVRRITPFCGSYTVWKCRRLGIIGVGNSEGRLTDAQAE